MSSNEPRDQLAAILAAQGIDYRRDIPFGGWPGDEATLYAEMTPDINSPDRVNWAGQEERRAAIQRLRCSKTADAILSAGWRPPARVIETASVLRDESHGTVIRFRDGTVAAVDTAGGHWPGRVMTLENPVYYWHLTDGDTELFPALVLWEPEEPAGGPHQIDVTHVAPGELERMARSGARPSPELRAAIDRARDRKGADQ